MEAIPDCSASKAVWEKLNLLVPEDIFAKSVV